MSRGCTTRFIIATYTYGDWDSPSSRGDTIHVLTSLSLNIWSFREARECCGSHPDQFCFHAYDADNKQYQGDCLYGRVSYIDSTTSPTPRTLLASPASPVALANDIDAWSALLLDPLIYYFSISFACLLDLFTQKGSIFWVSSYYFLLSCLYQVFASSCYL